MQVNDFPLNLQKITTYHREKKTVTILALHCANETYN